jgi:hypothetical protein
MKINGFYYNYSKCWPVLYKTKSYLFKGSTLCATIKTNSRKLPLKKIKKSKFLKDLSVYIFAPNKYH